MVEEFVPIGLQTRFLYPFSFTHGTAIPAARELLRKTVKISTENVPIWIFGGRVDNYYQELHDAAVDYLFYYDHESTKSDDESSFSHGCAYLTVNPVISGRWLQSLEVIVQKDAPPVRLATPLRIELWLSDHGVGLISLTLQPRLSASTTSAQILNFNYRIANWHVEQSIVRFRRHRNTNPDTADTAELATQFERDISIPLFERLAMGNAFDLAELVLGNPYFTPADLIHPDAFVAWLMREDASNNATPLRLAIADYFEKRYPGTLNLPWADARRAELCEMLNRFLRSQDSIFRPSNLLDLPLPEPLRLKVARRPRGRARVRLRRELLRSIVPDAFASDTSDFLLGALEDFEIERFQDRLSVYTVVHYPDSVDFGLGEVRGALGRELCALTNVEEPRHAGSATDRLNVTENVQNRRHWAAVGLLGAAHLVADQPGEVGFNKERVPRVLDKYFMPYLLATLQRLMLQRLQNDASEAALLRETRTQEKVVQLRQELLEFEVNGHFAVVSSREAIHRWYKLCQKGMEIPEFLDSVRKAFSEIDSNAYAVSQKALLSELKTLATSQKIAMEASARSLSSVESMQRKLEFFEVLIGAVYGGELGHIIGESIGHEFFFLPKLAPTLLGAAAGIGCAILLLRPWQHHGDSHIH